MASREEAIKQFSIRWPVEFWEAVKIAATRRRTSIQDLVTKTVAKELDLTEPSANGSDKQAEAPAA